MTSTVTELTITTIASSTYESLSTTLSVVVLVLLLVLLIQKELVWAFGGPRSGVWMQALDTAIVPLLVTFGLVVIIRILGFLQSG
jgi:hypothetical protein